MHAKREAVERRLTPEQNAMVEQYRPLGRSVALDYRGLGVEWDDLLQEANRGLCDAALTYDLSLGHAFAAYARPKCRARIADAIAVSSIVHGSERHDRDPEAFRFTRSDQSIDNYGFMPKDADSDEAEMAEHVEMALDACTDEGRAILVLVRGLAGPEMSLAKVAERLGMTRAEAKKHHDAACRTIAEAFRSHGWAVA